MGSSTQVGEVVSSSQVVDTVIPYPRVAMTRWGSLGLASQVEGEREPPTSRNDSLGLDVAGIAGGGGESPQRVVMTRWGLMWLASQVEGERAPNES